MFSRCAECKRPGANIRSRKILVFCKLQEKPCAENRRKPSDYQKEIGLTTKKARKPSNCVIACLNIYFFFKKKRYSNYFMHGICFLILLTGGPCKSMIYSFKLACAGSGVPILHRLLDDSRRPCAVKFSSSLNIVNMKLLRFGPVVNRHKNTCRRLNAIKLFFWFSSFFCFFFWLN